MRWGDVSKIDRNGPQDKRGHAVTKKESKVRGGVLDKGGARGYHKAAIWPNQTKQLSFLIYLSPQTHYSFLTHLSSIISSFFFIFFIILIDMIL